MVLPVTRFPIVSATCVQSCLVKCLHLFDGICLKGQMQVCDRWVSSRDIEFVEIEAGIIRPKSIALAECVENRAVKGFALFEI